MPDGAMLHAIGRAMGQYLDIRELPQVRQDPSLEAVLRRRGLGRFAASDLDVTELARRSCLQTLQRAGLDPARVDALVFATATFDIGGITFRSVRELHTSLGLTRAQPFGLFGTDCANLMSALRVAWDMLHGSRLEHVLVVTSDKASPAARVLDHYAAIYSDGAASCLLSASGDAGFQMDAIALTCSPELCEIDADDELGVYLDGFLQGAATTLERCVLAAGVDKTSIDWLLTGNLNRSVLKGYAYSLGVPEEKLLFDNAACFGHSFAADPLLNLQYLLETGRLREGDRCVLLGAGFNAWGASAVRVRGVRRNATPVTEAHAEPAVAGVRP